MYSGEYWDGEAGLQYLRARWYDPSMGRFINEDTYEGQIDNPLSLNLYTYVNNNPLKYTDPSGNKPIIWLDKEKKEYSYSASVRFLDGTLSVSGYLPFSGLVMAGAKGLRDSLSNNVFSEISSKDIKNAQNTMLTASGLNLLDVIGGLSTDKVKIAAGNAASVISFIMTTVDFSKFIFEDDTSWLVEDLFSPGLMVSNRREQITLRYGFASAMIEDMIASGSLKYSYNDKDKLTHNLKEKELEDMNYALLNFMIQTGAYKNKGDY